MYNGDQRCGGIRQAKTHTGTVDVVVDAGNSIAKGSHARGKSTREIIYILLVLRSIFENDEK